MLTQQPHRPFCDHCKIALAKQNGTSKHGFKQWHKYCSSCAKAMYDKKFGYLLAKKDKCDFCNFVPVDSCQMDLTYLDGNSDNKDNDNLITLCANCNRLHIKKLKKKSVFDITIDSDVRI